MLGVCSCTTGQSAPQPSTKSGIWLVAQILESLESSLESTAYGCLGTSPFLSFMGTAVLLGCSEVGWSSLALGMQELCFYCPAACTCVDLIAVLANVAEY